MKNHRHSMVPAAAVLILLLSSATAAGLAQAPSPSPSPGKMPQHQTDMKDMPGMSSMTGAPHHVLAMAYRDNLVTFAKALKDEVTQSKTVNPDLAGPAVAEMRRSFEQMRQHHQAQMMAMGDRPMSDKPMGDKPMGGMMMGDKMMGDKTKPPMSGSMQDMQSHLAALNEHLSALEAAVDVGTPDAKVVSAHTTEILKQCAKMSAKPAKTKPHHMK